MFCDVINKAFSFPFLSFLLSFFPLSFFLSFLPSFLPSSGSSNWQSTNLFKSIFDRTKAILANALSVPATHSESESPSAFSRIFGTIKDRLEVSQFRRRVLETKWYLKSRICFSGESVAEQYALHKWQWENCPMRQRWVWNLKLESIPEVDEELFEEDEQELEESEEVPDATYCSTAKRVRGREYFRQRFLTLKGLFPRKTHLRQPSAASHSDSSVADPSQEAADNIPRINGRLRSQLCPDEEGQKSKPVQIDPVH